VKNYDTKGAVGYLKSLGIGFSGGTLNLWRLLGRGPRFKKIGRKVFYEQTALDEFARGNE